MCRGAPWGNHPPENFKKCYFHSLSFCVWLKLGELKPHQLCLPWSYWARAHVQEIDKRNQISNTVYNQCVVPLMMYRSKTWALYCQIKRSIQQWDLRSILKIKWDYFIVSEWQSIWLIQQESPYVSKSSLCYLKEGATMSEMIPSR